MCITPPYLSKISLLTNSLSRTKFWSYQCEKGFIYINIISQFPCMFYSFRSNTENIFLLVTYCNQLVLLVMPHVRHLRTYLFLVEQNPCKQLKISSIGVLDLGKGFSKKQYMYLFAFPLLFKIYRLFFLF